MDEVYCYLDLNVPYPEYNGTCMKGLTPQCQCMGILIICLTKVKVYKIVKRVGSAMTSKKWVGEETSWRHGCKQRQ